MYCVTGDNGERLTDWYDDVVLMPNVDGLALVRKDGKHNYVSLTDGKMLLDEWADEAFKFNGNGLALVSMGSRFIIDRKGRQVSNGYKFVDVSAVDRCLKLIPVVTEDGRCGFIGDDGKFRSDIGLFLDYTPSMNDRDVVIAKRGRGGRRNNYVVNLVSGYVSEGFDSVSMATSTHFMVKKNGKYNVVDRECRLLLGEWVGSFDEAENELYASLVGRAH